MSYLDTIFPDIWDKKENEKTNITLLLVQPNRDQFVQILDSIYDYLNYNGPNHQRKYPDIYPDLLNYTFINPNETDEDSLLHIVEVYTIFSPQSNPLQLLSSLDGYTQNIDVLQFIDCNLSPLTKDINTFADESIEDFKKNTILPVLFKSLYPFCNMNSIEDKNWNSYTILFSNVSKWSYNAITLPLIDFIQQILRYLLIEQENTKLCTLIYFPFDLSNNKDKLNRLWCQINLSQELNISVLSNEETETIKYNDLFINRENDNQRNIQLLEETFNWTFWKSYWSKIAYPNEVDSKDTTQLHNLVTEPLNKTFQSFVKTIV